jgi:hypothetical protein
MLVGFCVALMVAMAIPTLRNVILSSHEMIGVLLAAGVIFVVGCAGRLSRDERPGQGRRTVPRGVDPLLQRRHDVPTEAALRRLRRARAVDPADHHRGVGLRALERRQPDRRPRRLAGGIVAIASGTLCLYGLRLEDLGLLPSNNVGPLIAALTCGICLGFLRDNFHPAKLFMGDAGALMLGLLMSASTMVIGGRTPPASGVTFFFFAPLLIPVFILGVPLIDAVWAFVRRTVSGQGFHTPDKNHIHHRLMRLGHGHRRTVVILWLWTAVLCGFVCCRSSTRRRTSSSPRRRLLLIGLMTWFSPLVNRLYYRAKRPMRQRESSRR